MSKLLFDVFSRHTKPSLEQLDQFISNSRQQQTDVKSQGYYDRLQRASSWLAKAKRLHTDSEARYIFLWIALNALYAIRPEVLDTPWWREEGELRPVMTKRQRDEKTQYELEWFLWRACCLNVGEKVLKNVLENHLSDVDKLISNRYLMSKYWIWKSHIEEEFDEWKETGLTTVKHAISSLNDQKKMYRALREIIIWRLRILRNQLFHGCATDTHSKRRAAGESELEAGSRILEELIWAFLVLMASQSEQARYWPPSPYPRAGSPQHKPFDASWLPE